MDPEIFSCGISDVLKPERETLNKRDSVGMNFCGLKNNPRKNTSETQPCSPAEATRVWKPKPWSLRGGA